MVYDTGFNKKPFPHRCGAVLDYCETDKGEILYFCSLCRLIVGVRKDGKLYMKPEVTGYKQKELSDKTVKDLQ